MAGQADARSLRKTFGARHSALNRSATEGYEVLLLAFQWQLVEFGRSSYALSARPNRRTRCFSPWAQEGLPGELSSSGRAIQAGSLCYINGCAVEVVAVWTLLQHL